MAEVQKSMEQFHEKIKLKNFDENKVLRDKRDIILNKLRLRLKKMFLEQGLKVPTFEPFNQGSYAMGTGVLPPPDRAGDYDIDVGLVFNVNKDDYQDPVEIKGWVEDALYKHTNDVKMKTPCITVQYQKEGEPIYHIDLAVYVEGGYNQLFHAVGKRSTPKNKRVWAPTGQKDFIDLVKNKFDGSSDRQQFRRIIRYLKRWKDLKFSANGNAAPVGIGLTVAALKLFSPVSDGFTNKYDDLKALINFVEKLITKFKKVKCDGSIVERLVMKLPVAPDNDVFSKMSNNQMTKFKEKLERLLETLKNARDYVDPHDACKALANEAFGSDFPVPDKSKTGSKTERAAIFPSSESA